MKSIRLFLCIVVLAGFVGAQEASAAAFDFTRWISIDMDAYGKAAKRYRDGDDSWDEREWDDAISRMTKAIDSGDLPLPNEARARYVRARSLENLGRADLIPRAMIDAEWLVENVPDHPHSWYLRGRFRQAMGQGSLALDDFIAAIRLDIEFKEASERALRLAADLGDEERWEVVSSAYFDAEFAFKAGLYLRQTIRLKIQGGNEGSIRFYTEVMSSEADAEMYYELARAALIYGAPDLAERYARAGRTQSGAGFQLDFVLATLAMQSGQIDRAYELLQPHAETEGIAATGLVMIALASRERDAKDNLVKDVQDDLEDRDETATSVLQDYILNLARGRTSTKDLEDYAEDYDLTASADGAVIAHLLGRLGPDELYATLNKDFSPHDHTGISNGLVMLGLNHLASSDRDQAIDYLAGASLAGRWAEARPMMARALLEGMGEQPMPAYDLMVRWVDSEGKDDVLGTYLSEFTYARNYWDVNDVRGTHKTDLSNVKLYSDGGVVGVGRDQSGQFWTLMRADGRLLLGRWGADHTIESLRVLPLAHFVGDEDAALAPDGSKVIVSDACKIRRQPGQASLIHYSTQGFSQVGTSPINQAQLGTADYVTICEPRYSDGGGKLYAMVEDFVLSEMKPDQVAAELNRAQEDFTASYIGRWNTDDGQFNWTGLFDRAYELHAARESGELLVTRRPPMNYVENAGGGGPVQKFIVHALFQDDGSAITHVTDLLPEGEKFGEAHQTYHIQRMSTLGRYVQLSENGEQSDIYNADGELVCEGAGPMGNRIWDSPDDPAFITLMDGDVARFMSIGRSGCEAVGSGTYSWNGEPAESSGVNVIPLDQPGQVLTWGPHAMSMVQLPEPDNSQLEAARSMEQIERMLSVGLTDQAAVLFQRNLTQTATTIGATELFSLAQAGLPTRVIGEYYLAMIPELEAQGNTANIPIVLEFYAAFAAASGHPDLALRALSAPRVAQDTQPLSQVLRLMAYVEAKLNQGDESVFTELLTASGLDADQMVSKLNTQGALYPFMVDARDKIEVLLDLDSGVIEPARGAIAWQDYVDMNGALVPLSRAGGPPNLAAQQSEPVAAPEPVAEPEPEPEPQPQPQPTPQPAQQPIPRPVSQPVPQPVQQSTPAPTPTPTPAPTPAAPDPGPSQDEIMCSQFQEDLPGALNELESWYQEVINVLETHDIGYQTGRQEGLDALQPYLTMDFYSVLAGTDTDMPQVTFMANEDLMRRGFTIVGKVTHKSWLSESDCKSGMNDETHYFRFSKAPGPVRLVDRSDIRVASAYGDQYQINVPLVGVNLIRRHGIYSQWSTDVLGGIPSLQDIIVIPFANVRGGGEEAIEAFLEVIRRHNVEGSTLRRGSY